MMTERGVTVDHSTIYRWVQHFAPEMEKRLRWQWRRPQSRNRFRFEVERLWRKWLGRRSWRGRMTWDRFARLRNTYPLPAARVVHSVYR